MNVSTEEKRDEVHALAQMRDELRLQLELGKAETREVWEQIEGRWEELERGAGRKFRSAGERLEPVADASTETAIELGAAAKLLLGEIADGYRRIREAL